MADDNGQNFGRRKRPQIDESELPADMPTFTYEFPQGSGADTSDGESGEAWPTLEQEHHHHHHSSSHSHSHSSSHSHSGSHHHHHRKSRRRRRRRRRIIAAVVVVVLLAILVPSGFFVHSALTVKDKVPAIKSEATQLVSALKSGDADAFTTQSEKLQSEATWLYEETNGLTWKIASHLPVVGNDVMGARKLVHAAYDAAKDVLPEVTTAMQESNGTPLLSSDFTYNAPVVKALCLSLQDNADVIAFHDKELNSIDSVSIKQISSIYDTTKSAVTVLDEFTHTDENYMQAVVDILACDTPRHYLILAQTNSEVRATAGFMGQYIEVTVGDGKIDIGSAHALNSKNDEGESFSYEPYEDPDAAFTSEEWVLFNTGLGEAAGANNKLGDLNFNPDFSRVGFLYSQAWDEKGMGDSLDGIIGMDVPMLQKLVELTGSDVTLDSGETIAADQICEELLYTTYAENAKNADQDARFRTIMDACIDTFANAVTKLDYAELAQTLSEGAEDSHLMAWMHVTTEQHLMHYLGLSHSFWPDEYNATVGVYLNNITWAKTDWFLSEHTDILYCDDNPDGSKSYHVQTTLTNHFTSDEEAEALPSVISGGNKAYKRSASDIVTGVYLYTPYDGRIDDITMEGNAFDIQWATYLDAEVAYGLCQIAAGEHTTINYTVTVKAEYADTPLRVKETPLCGNWD